MEGGLSESTKGMIPRAVGQAFQVVDVMRKKGWEHKTEGQFLEIVSETRWVWSAVADRDRTIRDDQRPYLGTGELDKKKHEIKHDETSTRVTDVGVAPLHSANQVQPLLSLAKPRRTVAATLMKYVTNSDSLPTLLAVFLVLPLANAHLARIRSSLRISGKNPASGDSREGSPYLDDLASSEQLGSRVGNDTDRLKETQEIKRSLSALGDVIAVLGEKRDGKIDKHIPYRDSKVLPSRSANTHTY